MNRIGVRRIAAFGVDWGVIVAWGGLVFTAVMVLSGGTPDAPAGPWAAQGIGLLAMTLPVWLYFSVLEGGRLQASLGKRVLGLRVVDRRGGRLGLVRSGLRNGGKLLPWEFGHLVAQQSIYSGESGLPPWIVLPMAVAFLVPLWWLVSLLRRGRAPYDRWAGAEVVATGEGTADET